MNVSIGSLRGHAIAALFAAAALTACHHRGGASPLITAVTPESVNIGGGNAPLLTVRGHGFEKRNTVHFGALRIPDVASNSDSVMQFAVPTDDTFLPNRGPVPVAPLTSGKYEVRIENVRGTSNVIAVTLVNGGGAR